MSKSEEDIKTCEACGASVYPEHIKRGTADFFGGKLMCPHCLSEKKAIAAVNPAMAYRKDADEDADEPIALAVDEEDPSAGSSTQIKAFGEGGISGGTTYGAPAMDDRYRRPLEPNAATGTRCRTFHCKLTDASLGHLNDAINEWADAHDDVRIKFATSCIGVFEGKSTSDAHLIVTVFY